MLCHYVVYSVLCHYVVYSVVYSVLCHYVAFLILEQIVAVIQNSEEKRPSVRELVMPPVLIINVNIKHIPHRPSSRSFTE